MRAPHPIPFLDVSQRVLRISSSSSIFILIFLHLIPVSVLHSNSNSITACNQSISSHHITSHYITTHSVGGGLKIKSDCFNEMRKSKITIYKHVYVQNVYVRVCNCVRALVLVCCRSVQQKEEPSKNTRQGNILKCSA